MAHFIRLIALIAFSISLQACASITAGTTQSVAVDTTPVQQAACTVQNEKGQWTIARTPGIATVTKAYGPLSVQCRTEAGHSGSSSVQSTTAGAAFGNILAGGIIGAAVDMGSGAAYQYPAQVLVSMTPPANQPPPTAPAAALPAPSLALCRIGKIEEYREEDWCRQAGGKVIRVGPPPQPPSVTPANVAPSSPPSATPPTAGGSAPSNASQAGNCYLPDGRKEVTTLDVCTSKMGFIGA
ncbi:hypothetical protein HL658_12920 [Azospirillum sp. RWY-5-1]|uniref:Uncharacterized protein n=1 Tax=Azospirillum oleiclasticum TaxID=2735135 RepID=A0ABX2TBI7_9PROT|nr:hypothetical protein [Azospirillum oleiclasticum]NYZ13455.1 hypothetical protein [Azospirillum oleiclasticum]NYZ20616.1 hypothetical protein [Azospirillum oleiclasticum]